MTNMIINLIVIALLNTNFILNSTVISNALNSFISAASISTYSTAVNLSQLRDSLASKAPNLNKQALTLALNAYQKAANAGLVKKNVLTVIDYSLPSSKERMWIFDLNKQTLLYNTFVAHGRNSGDTTPSHFSNLSSSKETSLGAYVTSSTYFGSKGYSLNLQGLEKGFNDNAYNRRVVVHGAWYVEPSFIKQSGRAGRSWGCPSIAKTLANPIINILKGGSILFAYYPDSSYLQKSNYAVA